MSKPQLQAGCCQQPSLAGTACLCVLLLVLLLLRHLWSVRRAGRRQGSTKRLIIASDLRLSDYRSERSSHVTDIPFRRWKSPTFSAYAQRS
jgi:hypothetical protein